MSELTQGGFGGLPRCQKSMGSRVHARRHSRGFGGLPRCHKLIGVQSSCLNHSRGIRRSPPMSEINWGSGLMPDITPRGFRGGPMSKINRPVSDIIQESSGVSQCNKLMGVPELMPVPLCHKLMGVQASCPTSIKGGSGVTPDVTN